MTNRTCTGFLLVVLIIGVTGCEGARPSSPTASSPVQPLPTPQPTPGGPADAVANVTLSGVVFEMTATGPVPIEGARVFLSDDQDIATDASGSFSFKPVWVCPCRPKLMARVS
jgi:hypothetical protein